MILQLIDIQQSNVCINSCKDRERGLERELVKERAKGDDKESYVIKHGKMLFQTDKEEKKHEEKTFKV